MKNASEIMTTIANNTGWNTESQLSMALQFIDAHCDMTDFHHVLKEQSDYEMSFNKEND